MTERYWIAIPAAGRSERFGGSTPKQYCSVAGATLLDHCLSVFLEWEFCHTVVVAVSADDHQFHQSRFAQHPQVVVVIGGAQRAESVLNCLDYIVSQAGENDYVMVHDAARPLLQITQLEALRLALQQHQAVILAQPLSDTLKRGEDQLVVATLPRDQLWAAQTPQCALVSVLRSALAGCLNRGLTVTDEASALEAANIQVYFVEGPRRNFKITWPDDLALAQQVLENQQ